MVKPSDWDKEYIIEFLNTGVITSKLQCEMMERLIDNISKCISEFKGRGTNI